MNDIKTKLYSTDKFLKENVYFNNSEIDNKSLNFYDGKYVFDKNTRDRHKPWKKRSVGLDLGRTMDRSVLSIIDYCIDEKYRLVGLYKMRDVPINLQLKYVEKICSVCLVDIFTYDETSMGGKFATDIILSLDENNNNCYPYISQISQPVNFTKDLKINLYSGMKLLMEKKELFLYNDTEMIKELKNLVRETNGKIHSATKNVNDDIPSSIILALHPFIIDIQTEPEFYFL